MWVFPQSMYSFLEELEAKNASKYMIMGCQFGAFSLGLFNVAIFFVILEKCIRYTKRTIKGLRSVNDIVNEPLDDDKDPIAKSVMYDALIGKASNKKD